MKQIVLLLIGCLVIHNGIAGPRRTIGRTNSQFDHPVAIDLYDRIYSARGIEQRWFRFDQEFIDFHGETTGRRNSACDKILGADSYTSRAYLDGWGELYRAQVELDIGEIEYWRMVEEGGWDIYDVRNGTEMERPTTPTTPGPVLPEPVLPEPVLPEPVLPEPVLPKVPKVPKLSVSHPMGSSEPTVSFDVGLKIDEPVHPLLGSKDLMKPPITRSNLGPFSIVETEIMTVPRRMTEPLHMKEPLYISDPIIIEKPLYGAGLHIETPVIIRQFETYYRDLVFEEYRAIYKYRAIGEGRLTHQNARTIDFILDRDLLPEWCKRRSSMTEEVFRAKVHARMLSAYENAMHFHDIAGIEPRLKIDAFKTIPIRPGGDNVSTWTKSFGEDNAKLLLDVAVQPQRSLIDMHKYSSLACQSFLQANEGSGNNHLQAALEAEHTYNRISLKFSKTIIELDPKCALVRTELKRLSKQPNQQIIENHVGWFDEFGTDLYERFSSVRPIPDELLIGDPQININTIKFFEASRQEQIAACYYERWGVRNPELRLKELKDASLRSAAEADYWRGLAETRSAEVLRDVLPRWHEGLDVRALTRHELNTIRKTFSDRSIACREQALLHARDFYTNARTLQKQRIRNLPTSHETWMIETENGPIARILLTDVQMSELHHLANAYHYADRACYHLLRSSKAKFRVDRMNQYRQAATNLQLVNRELFAHNQLEPEYHFRRTYIDSYENQHGQHVTAREWHGMENARLSEVRLYNPYFDHPGSPHQEALRTRERIIEEHHSTNREITPEQGRESTALRNVGIGIGAVCAIAALVYAGYEIYNLCTHDQNTQDTPERYIPQETRRVESFVPNPLELRR